MGLEFLLIVLGVVLFGGMFAGLALAYREIEADRAGTAAANEAKDAASGFYDWRAADQAVAQELMLRELEHYLRRESMVAEQFINDPSLHTLRVRGGRKQIGAC